MILDRQRLVNCLLTIGCSVGNKIMKVADYVQFRLDRENRRLFVSVTNFTSFMTMDYGDLGIADITDFPEEFLLDYKMITSILKMSTTKDVDIRQDKVNGPIIVVTNGKYELQRYGDSSEFPACEYENEMIAKMPVHEIEAAWNKASIAVSKDVTKLSYQGVNFDGNFVATDNHRVSIANLNPEYKGPSIILMPVFGEILKRCKNEVVIGFNKKKNLIIILCQEVGLIASVRLIDAKFVDYRPFFNAREDAIRITYPKQEMIGALDRLENFTDQIYKVIHIVIVKDGSEVITTLSVENQSAGSEKIVSSKFQLPDELVDVDGELVNAKYQLDNMKDGIIVTEDQENVVLNIQSDSKVWIEEEKFHYLLTNIKQ